MTTKISDTATPHKVIPWNASVGREIQMDCSILKKPAEFDQKVFNTFINQIPKIRSLIGKLRQENHISEVHLPLPLCTIFFIFIDELVELYQTQLEQKDQVIERELQEIKRLYARKINQHGNLGTNELKGFFCRIKEKLNAEAVLPPKFDELVAIWSEILSIKYIGILSLAALYEKGAEKRQLMSITERNQFDNATPHGGYDEISLKIKTIKEDKCIKFQNPLGYVLLSHNDLERSFFLLLKQIFRDASWVLPEMLEKMPLIEDKKLELDVRGITTLYNNALLNEPTSSLARKYEKKFREFMANLSSMDIHSNDSIKRNQGNLSDEYIVCSTDIGRLLNDMKRKGKDSNVSFKMSNGTTVDINDSLIQCAEKINDCYLIKKSYLYGPRVMLVKILDTLFTSNKVWKQFNEKKTMLILYSQVQLLLPPIVDYDKIDEWANSIKSSPSQPQPKSTKKKQLRNPATPPKKAIPQNVANQTSYTLIPKNNTPPLLPLSSIDRLKLKLLSLHKAAPSRALRQALWHLDTLIVIQNSLPRTKINAPHCLSLATIVASSSQKILEQTYRFCLKEENSPLARNHDLKVYHRAFEPGCTTFPPVVKKLFLANTWFRYFYAEHEKWNSLTMRLASIPSVLGLLVKIAEGQALSPQELDSFVNGTIEDVRKHTEFLLKNAAAPPAQEEFASSLLEPKEPLLMKTSFRSFDLVNKALEGILKKSKLHSRHSISLRIKQALAAIKMLKISQEKISQARDIPAFSTWTVWSLHQLQESMENVLHAIEHSKEREMSINHEMGPLAEKVGLDMGPLGGIYHNLSYKTRYPAEVVIESLPAQIIDDLEALKQHPEILQGFNLQELPAMLWAKPSKDLSLEAIAKKLNTCMIQSEEFLRLKALPALEKCLA